MLPVESLPSSSPAYLTIEGRASSAMQLSHHRGQGPVPPQGAPREELSGLLGKVTWSSFKGEEANLVSPFSPVCGGLMGGALREALPTSFSAASLGICATIDPALTRHLSDSAHNDIVRALRAAPELIDHHDLHNGRCIVTCGFRGDSGPVGVALSIDRDHPPEKVTDIHISYPNGRGLSAPVHAPAVMLAGLAAVLPERIKLDDPWLVNVLAGLVQFSVNVSYDPGDPAMRTVELSNAAQRVQLRLCETPDGRHEIEEATLELRGVTSQQCSTAATPAAPVTSTSTDSLQAQMNDSRPVVHPQAGFSYARSLVLRNEQVRTKNRADARVNGLPVGPSVTTRLENAIKAAQHASSDSWTPTNYDLVWRITVTCRGTAITLRVVFDNDRLDHACDVRMVQGDDDDVRPKAKGLRAHYDLWSSSVLSSNGRATLVKRWFDGSAVFDAWVKANPGREHNDIVVDALDACARLDRQLEGTAHTERRDGSPVGVAALDAGLHIYRYDVVLAEKDLSMVLQFTHANRRVLRRIAVLGEGVTFNDQMRTNFCADPAA